MEDNITLTTTLFVLCCAQHNTKIRCSRVGMISISPLGSWPSDLFDSVISTIVLSDSLSEATGIQNPSPTTYHPSSRCSFLNGPEVSIVTPSLNFNFISLLLLFVNPSK